MKTQKSKCVFAHRSKNADPYYEQVEMIENHNDAALVDEASVNLFRMQHHQKGQNFPYAFIPET